jgi:ATP-dependent helicase/nuclease subunit B
VRLRAFARVQAAEYAAGWRILEVEKRIDPTSESPLTLGPLALSAQVDRIERHPDFGLRILDYKTFSQAKSPAKTHFAAAQPDHFLPESQVLVEGKEKTWTDLQLPLYRSIASRLYPDATIQTAYFLLTADPSETQIATFDLDEATYRSALTCAEAIAYRIAQGRFWPPQPHRSPWTDPLAALFLNGKPEDCLTPETIAFLKGPL